MGVGLRGAQPNLRVLSAVLLCAGVLPLTVIAVPQLVVGLLFAPFVESRALAPGGYIDLAPVTAPFGAWGLASLWYLTIHFLRRDVRPNALWFASLGLGAGTVAGAVLVRYWLPYWRSSVGALHLGSLLFAFMVAFYLALRMWKAPPNSSSATLHAAPSQE